MTDLHNQAVGCYSQFLNKTDTNVTMRYWYTFSLLAVPAQTEATQNASSISVFIL